MKKLIQQRIHDYADYFGRNIPYFHKDGSTLTELNFDFDKLSDEFLTLYEEAVIKGDVDNELLQDTNGTKEDYSKILEKVKLQDEDLKELFEKLQGSTVFEGSIVIVNQKISDEVLFFVSNSLLYWNFRLLSLLEIFSVPTKSISLSLTYLQILY